MTLPPNACPNVPQTRNLLICEWKLDAVANKGDFDEIPIPRSSIRVRLSGCVAARRLCGAARVTGSAAVQHAHPRSSDRDFDADRYARAANAHVDIDQYAVAIADGD